MSSRRRLLRALILGSAGLGALVALGPRPRVDLLGTPVSVPSNPADLERYLADAEAAFDDLVPGTEKQILWADPEAPGVTEFAVVYLHGFSATHRETAPLTEELAERLGANAYLSRLTGHGRSGEALGEATGSQWLRDAEEAVRIGATLGRRVVLLGVSTGGTLATWAAAQPELGALLAAVVLISPNYGPRDPLAWVLTAPWGRQIARLVQGPEYSFEPENELQGRYWTERYPTRVLSEMAALTKLIDRELAAAVTVPALVFVAPADRIIEAGAVEEVFERIGSSEKRLVRITDSDDPSEHVIVGDILSPGTTPRIRTMIVDFARSVTD